MIFFIYILFSAEFLVQDGVNSKVIKTHESSNQEIVKLKVKNSNQTITEGSVLSIGTAAVHADDCDCINAICVMEKGEKVCQCLPEYGKFNSKECKACDCGKDTNCTIQTNAFRMIFKTCICNPGYVLDPRARTCLACNCGKESNCTLEQHLFRNDRIICKCKSGYTVKDGTCVGPCTENPCKNGGSCTDVENGYKCICSSEYSGKNCDLKNGEHPCNDLGGNEACKLLNAKCKLNFEEAKGYTCICDKGNLMDQDTAKCRPLHLCSDGGGNEVCKLINAKCILNSKDPKGYTCICEEGNIRDKDTLKCRPVHKCYDEGGNEACKSYNAECELNSAESKGYICVCIEGEVKDEDTKKCRPAHRCNDGEGNEVCKLLNAKCVLNLEDPKGYTCICEDGNIKDNGTAKCRPVHPCVDRGGNEACILLNAECVINSNESNEYICICNEGEVKDENTRKCRPVHVCNDGGGNDVCELYNAKCVLNLEDPKGYTCICEDGNIRDKDTGKCRHICDTAKCLHGKCEKNEMGSFKCKCEEGFTGLHCEEKDQTISISGYGNLWIRIHFSLNLSKIKYSSNFSDINLSSGE